MITQKQTWPGFDRHIIMTKDGAGSVQIELYNTPMSDGTIAYICSLWVRPEHRKKGIATALMNAAEELITQEARATATLINSHTEAPHEICDWYIRRGYEVINSRKIGAMPRKQLRQ